MNKYFVLTLFLALSLTACAGQATRVAEEEPLGIPFPDKTSTNDVNTDSCDGDANCEEYTITVGTGANKAIINPGQIDLIKSTSYNSWPFIGFHADSIDNPGYAIGMSTTNNTLLFMAYDNTRGINSFYIDQNGEVNFNQYAWFNTGLTVRGAGISAENGAVIGGEVRLGSNQGATLGTPAIDIIEDNAVTPTEWQVKMNYPVWMEDGLTVKGAGVSIDNGIVAGGLIKLGGNNQYTQEPAIEISDTPVPIVTVNAATAFDGALKINEFAGNGTGYVCFNNEGHIFPSKTPCN